MGIYNGTSGSADFWTSTADVDPAQARYIVIQSASMSCTNQIMLRTNSAAVRCVLGAGAIGDGGGGPIGDI